MTFSSRRAASSPSWRCRFSLLAALPASAMAQETAPARSRRRRSRKPRRARSGQGRRHDRRPADHRGRPRRWPQSELDQQFAQLPPEQRRAAALSAIIEIRLLAAQGGRRTASTRTPISSAASAFLQQRALHSELVDKEVAAKITDAGGPRPLRQGDGRHAAGQRGARRVTSW